MLAVYSVTTSNLTGEGSILEAVEMANKTPGLDTIQFEPGLQIDLTDGPLSGEFGVARLTESAIIDGAGSTVYSAPAWISSAGDVNNDSTVDSPFTIEVSPSMRFLEIGTFGEDNTGIEVTVRNLKAEQLNQFARGEVNSSLTIENVDITGFRAVTHPEDSFIQGTFKNLTIRDTTISRSKNFGELVYAGDSAFIFSGGIGGSGDLVMENVTMIDNYSAGAVLWTGGSATIVSSRFVASGGIQMFDTNATIVNSVFDLVSSDENSNTIFAGAGSQVDLIASTVRVEFHGDPPSSSGVEFNGRPLLASGGHITLKGSAVYGGQADSEFGPFPGIAYYATQGGTLSADEFSWVSPVDDQNSEALKLLFQNPNLRTQAPGLSTELLEAYPQSVTPLLGTPEELGVLIDVIPEAGAGRANELVNPIDGQPILLDALGNRRVDGNGFRNIGAVQLTLAPHLAVTGTGDMYVDLSWSRPDDPPAGPITGYHMYSREAGATEWTDEGISYNAAETAVRIVGFTNGVTYEFEVAAVTDAGDGPRSNFVSATPYGPVQPPQPVATPGVYEVELDWSVPTAGGHTISGYGVYYRLVGSDSWTYFGEVTGTSATVTGLQHATAYEFGVKTITTAGVLSSELGTTTSTTLNDAPLAVDDFYTAYEDHELVIVASGVLANDSDANGDALTAVLVGGPGSQQGTLTLDSDGSFVFLPATNFAGPVTFTYKAVDPIGDQSDEATVTIMVTSSQEQIEELRSLLLDLCESGTLNHGQCNSLLVKLEHAKSKLLKGQSKVSYHAIRAFEHEIRALTSAEILSQEESEPLLKAADQLLRSLELGGGF